MSSKTIFQKIISGELPSFKVWEDEGHFAFLDISPFAPGHTLVIPKRPAPYIFDLDDSVYMELLLASKTVANILKKAMDVPRVGVIVAGYGVQDHVHVHLVPIHSEKDLFGGPKNMTKAQLQKIHHKILEAMNAHV